MKSKVIGLTFISLILLIIFQNCKQIQSTKPKETSEFNPISQQITYDAGDTGYEGLLETYAVSSRAGELCADGKKSYKEVEIDFENNRAFLTRDKCKEVTRQEIDLSALELMPHNFDAFPDQDMVFERVVEETRDRELFAFCRGLADDNGSGRIVVDIITYYLGDNRYQARVVSGKYNTNGDLVETRDSGIVSTYRWDPNPDFPEIAYFGYRNSEGVREWYYHVKGGHITKGSLNYELDKSQEWKQIWSFPCLRYMD